MMKKQERSADDGESDDGTDGTSSHDKSIADHAKAHPHDGHDGTQDEEHSQPKHGKSHHDMKSDGKTDADGDSD